MENNLATGLPAGVTEEDFQWFLRSPYLAAIPEGPKRCLFATMQRLKILQGRRIISQGDEGNEFYIIRKGHCLVNQEKDGCAHLVGRLGPGQIVGEMAILTGEKRNANVDAETDMELWAVSRDDFDQTCDKYPQLRQILTRIVTDRLSEALLQTERSIGKYFIERIIGEGGCSFVYKGYHASLGLPVAIKMLKHHMAMEPSFLQQFRNEGKTIAQLNHPNIVKVYDVEEVYRTFFIIMEFIEGRSLALVLRDEERPTVAEMLNFLLQTCSGLQHAHEHGVVHGDIKPGNILIQTGNRVRIVDFGFARPTGSMDEQACGTVHYISPEQIARGALDERSDIYSLGMTAYEMFTGKKACPSEDETEILEWHLREDVKDPGDVAAGVPEELRAFVTRATRRDPQARFRNMKEVIRALEPLSERLGAESRSKSADEMNMMSLFVFYRNEQQPIMQRILRDLSRELEKVGARLRGANFKNVQK